MAETLFVPCLILFSMILFPFSSPRALPFPHTSTLNVADSIQSTLFFKQVEEQTVHNLANVYEEEQNRDPDSSLTLRLFPRSSLPTTEIHRDYKSFILSRLERDSARVESLNARIDLAIHGLKASDLRPINNGDLETEALEGAVVSGSSQGSGEYFTRLGIGSPASQLYVVLDTGSDVSWIQCEACSDCYQQTDPIFRPSGSSSYSQLSCDAPQCKALDVSECRAGHCLYEVSYGDGSYTVGDFATERITFGSGSVNDVAIGCGHNNEGLFVGAAGLLGLGGGSLSFPSQINSSSFSYCLVDRDSTTGSTLDFNSPLPVDAVTAPLIRNRQLDTFFYVGLSGISVGGQMLSVPSSSFRMDEAGNGGVIVDSGTAVSRLQTAVYNALRDAFVSGTQHLPKANGVALFDTCYDLASMKSVEVPTVAFHFPGGKRLPLPAKNYVIPVDSSGTFCLAFAPTSSPLSIIGNVQQQGTRVGFDLANKLVGFSPNKC